MIDDMFRLQNGFERLHQASSFEKSINIGRFWENRTQFQRIKNNLSFM